MGQLTTVEAVRKRGSLGDVDAVNERIGISLNAASLHLASLLRTDFDRKVIQDRYYVDWDEFPFIGGGGDTYQYRRGGGFIKLFHSQGFVDTNESYTIKVALNLSDFANAGEIDSDYLQIEGPEGLVLITSNELDSPAYVPFTLSGRQFYQIDYTAGFLTKSAKYGKVYQGVPEWLQEAATMASLTIYRAVCRDDDESAAFNPSLIYPLQSFLERYIRFYPSALKPLVGRP